MRFPIPGHHAPVGIVLEREPDNIIAAGQKHLNSFSLQNPQKVVNSDLAFFGCTTQALSKCLYSLPLNNT